MKITTGFCALKLLDRSEHQSGDLGLDKSYCCAEARALENRKKKYLRLNEKARVFGDVTHSVEVCDKSTDTVEKLEMRKMEGYDSRVQYLRKRNRPS